MTFPLGNWLDEQEHAGRLSRSAYEKSAVQMQKNYFTYKKKEG